MKPLREIRAHVTDPEALALLTHERVEAWLGEHGWGKVVTGTAWDRWVYYRDGLSECFEVEVLPGPVRCSELLTTLATAHSRGELDLLLEIAGVGECDPDPTPVPLPEHLDIHRWLEDQSIVARTTLAVGTSSTIQVVLLMSGFRTSRTWQPEPGLYVAVVHDQGTASLHGRFPLASATAAYREAVQFHLATASQCIDNILGTPPPPTEGTAEQTPLERLIGELQDLHGQYGDGVLVSVMTDRPGEPYEVIGLCGMKPERGVMQGSMTISITLKVPLKPVLN